MQRFVMSAGPARQRGWVGLLVILLALLIVAWLAKDALKAYGLSSTGEGGPAGSRPRAERLNPGVAGAEADGAPSTPMTPLERARSVEGTLQRDADERAKRVDDAAK
jgi:hypothetical protein